MQTNLRPIASLLLGVAFLLAGNGLQTTLIPLRGAAEGFGSFEIGVIGSSYYLGFVAGCLLAPYAILSAGHIRAFTAMVALAVRSRSLMCWRPMSMPGSIFRLINGFCLAGIYLVIESWLNDRASNQTRGLIMSSYVIVNFAAFTVGQLLVTLYPIEAGRQLHDRGHAGFARHYSGGADPFGAAGADCHSAISSGAACFARRRSDWSQA